MYEMGVQCRLILASAARYCFVHHGWMAEHVQARRGVAAYGSGTPFSGRSLPHSLQQPVGSSTAHPRERRRRRWYGGRWRRQFPSPLVAEWLGVKACGEQSRERLEHAGLNSCIELTKQRNLWPPPMWQK